MYVSPTTAQHVAKQLGKSIPYILEGGPSTVGVESTIVSFENEPPTILRHGGVTKEAIEKVIGPLNVLTKIVEATSERLDSPGQFKRHYSANKPTQRLPNIPAEWWASPTSIGFLGFDKTLNLAVGPELSKAAALVPSKNQFILSPKTDLNVAAALLFGTLRLLDEHPAIEYIILDNFPQSGLGLAINDRLSRAVNI
jgi:L-threonylcarbamoyladenylate synthase